MTTTRPRVLCVDDEPRVLEGLDLHLRRRYDVVAASGGAEGLACLDAHPDTAVVLSDMQMPGMSGAEFLRQVHDRHRDVTRVMLTGQTDQRTAIAAVNDGQIFRFLTKPCAPTDLLRAVELAVEQHRLVTAERVLLEQTLLGSVQALVDVLALADPVSFGNASRIKGIVAELAKRLDLPRPWQVEVAAMLSQLGCITLPAETLDAMINGRPLGDHEAAMVRRVPSVTDALLRHIPRLEAVRGIVLAAAEGAHPAAPEAACLDPEIVLPAAVLRAAADYDLLMSRGDSPALAVETLRGRVGRYDVGVLTALAALAEPSGDDEVDPATQRTLREVPITDLRVGMVLAADLRARDGILLAARGFEVTIGLVERAANLSDAERRQLVRVLMPADERGAAGGAATAGMSAP